MAAYRLPRWRAVAGLALCRAYGAPPRAQRNARRHGHASALSWARHERHCRVAPRQAEISGAEAWQSTAPCRLCSRSWRWLPLRRPRPRRSIRSRAPRSWPAPGSISRSNSPARWRRRTSRSRSTAATRRRCSARPRRWWPTRKDRTRRPIGSAKSRSRQPGAYAVAAAAGDKSQTVQWEVFGTPARRARNVILFIGDGLSVAHRTAARVLSKGLVEGRYGGELAIDDMPHMALVSTSGTDCHRHRLRQLHECLHHRPQVLRQRHGRLLRAQQERPRAPQGRDHRRAGEAPQRRHGRRRRHQHRDRGRDARRHGRARAPPQRLRRDRAHVLRRSSPT